MISDEATAETYSTPGYLTGEANTAIILLRYGKSPYPSNPYAERIFMSIKMTVNLPEQTVEALKNIAGDRGTTVTEALRQVIESQRFLENEMQKGNSLLIQNPDKSLRQVVFNTPPKNSST